MAIKEIYSANIEKVISVYVQKDGCGQEKPFENTIKYYTKDGVYIGEIHNPPTIEERIKK